MVLHRLNRKEYANAVRDLFQLKVDPALILPQDDTSDSFDNVADVLQVSASFLDQNISAARTIAIEAVGDQKMKPTRVNLKPDPGVSQGQHVDGLPLGTRGGLVADHVIPAEGDYVLTFTGPGVGVYDDNLHEDRFLAFVDGKPVFDTVKDGPAWPPRAAGTARQPGDHPHPSGGGPSQDRGPMCVQPRPCSEAAAAVATGMPVRSC